MLQGAAHLGLILGSAGPVEPSRQTAGSSAGGAGSGRATCVPPRNRPVRVARVAQPSQIRSSSGAACAGRLEDGPNLLDGDRIGLSSRTSSWMVPTGS